MKTMSTVPALLAESTWNAATGKDRAEPMLDLPETHTGHKRVTGGPRTGLIMARRR